MAKYIVTSTILQAFVETDEDGIIRDATSSAIGWQGRMFDDMIKWLRAQCYYPKVSELLAESKLVN